MNRLVFKLFRSPANTRQPFFIYIFYIYIHIFFSMNTHCERIDNKTDKKKES